MVGDWEWKDGGMREESGKLDGMSGNAIFRQIFLFFLLLFSLNI